MNAETPDDQLRVHTDRQALCRTVAEDLVDVLREAVDTRGTASAVLTGGGTGTGILEALAAPELAGQVDWSAVHLWWGDERFLPAGNGERNEVLATDVASADAPLDVTSPAGVQGYVRSMKPDWLIHCAAYTDVDGCEEKQDLAFELKALFCDPFGPNLNRPGF